MTDGLYKWDDKKGWCLDFNKVNKVLFDFKAIREELDCDNEENGKISCGNCPFYGIHHCDVFRANIDTIRFIKDESTVDRVALAESQVRRIERLLDLSFSKNENKEIVLDEEKIKKLQKIFSEKAYLD